MGLILPTTPAGVKAWGRLRLAIPGSPRPAVVKRCGKPPSVGKWKTDGQPSHRQTEKAVMKELQELQGTWVVVEAEIQGRRRDANRAALSLTIEGDHFTMKSARHATDLKGKLTIDPSKQPKTMDWSALRPEDNLALTATGIYEVKDDTLTFCYGEKRPTEFKTKADPALDERTYVFRREKN
jgi:uncharacterized protein (TIGR03067 family)